MVEKTLHATNHIKDLKEIFQQLRTYNMKLNPKKCAFGVQGGKFLSFILTCRGIEANPEKYQAILNMRSPRTVKEVQQFTSRLAALSQFLLCIAHRSHHFFKALRKQEKFEWSEECEKAFTELKTILSKPPILHKLELGKLLYLYLSVTNHAISSVLVTETGKQHHPVYFISKSLQQAEVRYPRIEKLALALIIMARQLTLDKSSPTISNWTLYVDEASNNKGSGAGILLEDEQGTALEQSLQFTFHASNNQAEYEALIARLKLAHTMGITQLSIKCDSLLVVQQITGNFQVKDPLLEKYNAIVNNLIGGFQNFNISHIPREQNDKADILSKLATTRSQTKTPTLSQLTLDEPSVMLTAISSISQEEEWRKPFVHYLQTGQIPDDVQNKRKFKRRVSFYTLLGYELYKRGFTRPLLKCLDTTDAKLAMDEVHEGVCGTRIGGQSLASKILRASYYWPTLQQDCIHKVQHFDHYQCHAPVIHNPAEQLHSSEGLRKKLEDSKGEWAELIPEVLWSYNTIEQSSKKEIPFRLVYGCVAMLPVKISLQSPRTASVNEDDNIENRRTELDLVEENRNKSALQQLTAKRAIAWKYNKKLKSRTFL
ncbi:uncharacterized protein LOC130965914 [Arachis stenosperma]|uniref:uncharacterized protein LOC130965914 n=1 Tax=Arachis stenosperma TaxID=217475 RepID=UPI0025ABC8D9|nr:uncharacterized protein LOC130965914 [Arachis stenosperma]